MSVEESTDEDVRRTVFYFAAAALLADDVVLGEGRVVQLSDNRRREKVVVKQFEVDGKCSSLPKTADLPPFLCGACRPIIELYVNHRVERAGPRFQDAYEIEIHQLAVDELDELRVYDQRIILDEIETQLSH